MIIFTRKGFVICSLLFSLTACATYNAHNIAKTKILNAQQEIPEEELLDVGITVFKSSEIKERKARKEGTNLDVRNAENHFIPYHLKNTLEQSAYWGMIRVTPLESESADVLVQGEIIESKELPGIYNGITDGEDWFNHGNIGESTTDFSIFEDFHRAYFIFKTKNHGFVAQIPVGLNTISALFSSVVNHHSTMVPPGSKPVAIHKGDELGHFAYGGSLNILLFQKGVLGSISVLMGQRLGTLSAPYKPK